MAKRSSSTSSDALPDGQSATPTAPKMVHPIIIFPYKYPQDTQHLKALYDTLIKRVAKNTQKYCRPITVLNRQTFYGNKDKQDFNDLLEERVKKYSEVVNAWSVDTCQMWLEGFGRCFDSGHTSDVYWLIPGDFNYGSEAGEEVLARLEDLPNKVYKGECELCLGEIEVAPNSSKQLIDTYGTYGLLYNWFPAQAQGIREITDKPRTEFFAIGHNYLKYALNQRWYAYEQTIIILLHGMRGRWPSREIKRVRLGGISDEPQGRDSLASAMQQVERTERVMKLYWRELNEAQNASWPDIFRKLDGQSEQIRGTALVILEQLLRK